MNQDQLPIKIDVKVDSKDMLKFATKLIDTISSPFRWFAKYKEPVKQAKADVEATLIKAKALDPLSAALGISKEEAVSLIFRSGEREQYDRINQQNNIEKIVQTSVTMLPSSVNDLPVEEDWVSDFFEQCKNISDKEMQTLWAKILAGEVAQPGTYSRRVLAFIKTLSRQEADLITRFCCLLWNNPGFGFMHIRIGSNFDYLKKYNIEYIDLIEMESMGLLRFDTATVFSFEKDEDNPLFFFYHGEPHYLYTANREGVTNIHVFAMTSLGNCLAPIAGSVRNEEYYLESIDTFTKISIHISDKPPRTP